MGDGETWRGLFGEVIVATLLFGGIWLAMYRLLHRFVGRWAAKLFVLVLVLTPVAVVDWASSIFLWLAPRMVWPPFHPALPIRYLAATIIRPVNGAPYGTVLLRHIWMVRPEPGFALLQAPWVLLGLAITWRVLVGPWHLRHSRLRAARAATHGSARWRRASELGETMRRTACDAPTAAGITVGSGGGRATVTRPEVGNPHLLLLGATRAGKSRRVILPTVWCLGHRGESMVLTDPKGELYQHSAAWLRSQGYEVVLIDLLRPSRGNRWNPLASVVVAHKAGDDEEASRLAWEIGNVLAFAETGQGTDPIWPQAEESTIAALALGAALEAPDGARHPATMYRMLSELGGDGHGGVKLDGWFRSLTHEHLATRAYGTAALSESRTRSSIYTGTAAHLRIFADPGVAWLTAESDHDPADAGRRKTAIFLLLPDEAGARRPVASLYVAQAYSALAGVARANGGKLPVPVWFLLDEFGNVGKLPGIAEKLTVSAGRNIRFLLAVQSIAQIDHIYGPKVREVLTGNCDTTLFLRAADQDTAKLISEKAGTYTVLQTSVQRQRGWVGGGTDSGTGRALLTPDEVLRWPLGESLILQAGQYPARLPLADLSKWRAANAAFGPAEMPAARSVGTVAGWCPRVEIEDDKPADPPPAPEAAIPPMEEVQESADPEEAPEEAPVAASPAKAFRRRG